MLFLHKLTASALFLAAVIYAVPLEERSGKAPGGPASATVTIYNGPYDCTSVSTPPPTDGTAGVNTTVTVSELTCAVVAIPYDGAITAKLTATPKTGSVACYVQVYANQGCGSTLTNQYHGFPFSGVTVGSTVGCGNPPAYAYGAVGLVCA
ncbi:hypothetical protein MBLNU459_g2859t4 [Dothideomycetes sp. NU459]